MFQSIFLLFHLVNSQVLTLDEQLSALQNLAKENFSSYETVNGFSYLKISSNLNNQKNMNIFLVGSLYAGYKNNLDFLLELASDLTNKLSSGDSSTIEALTNKVLHIIPIFNEPAYKAWQVNQGQGIYETDQSITDFCPNNYTGVNPNHNFEFQQSVDGNYSNQCSTDYSGDGTSILMVNQLQDLISRESVKGLLVYHLDNLSFIKPYTYTAENIYSTYENVLYDKELSNYNCFPSEISLQNIVNVTGAQEFGTLLDYSADKEIPSLQLAASGNYDTDSQFALCFLSFIKANITATFTGSEFSKQENSTVDNSTVITETLTLQTTIANSGPVTIGSLCLLYEGDFSDTLEIVSTSSVSIIENDQTEGSISCIISSSENYINALNCTTSLSGFNTLNIALVLRRSSDLGENSKFQLTASSLDLDDLTSTIDFEVEYDGDNEENNDSNDNDSDNMSPGRKKAIIIASVILIAINVVLIIIAIVWKICHKQEDSRDFDHGVPTFNPKSQSRV